MELCERSKEWQKLYFSEFEVRCRAIDDINFPDYCGATFRGAFGAALKTFCMMDYVDCARCDLNEACPYNVIFERAYGDSRSSNPYIFTLPDDLGSPRANAEFHFSFTLLGSSLNLLYIVIDALVEMGEKGIGKGRGKFAVVEVIEKKTNQQIYFDGEILAEYSVQRLEKKEISDEIAIKFVTPLRLKNHGRYIYVPEFSDLVHAILRRMSFMVSNFCDANFELDFDALIKESHHITIKRDSTEWTEFNRYSYRQGTKIPMHGVIGEIVYAGDFSAFEYLISAMEHISIGSSTSFGFGQIYHKN